MRTEAHRQMATIKVETTVRRALSPNGPVKQSSTDAVTKEEREVTLTRQVGTVDDVMWALDAKEHEVVYDLWEEQMGEYWEDWGWYGYPKGDVTISLNGSWNTYGKSADDLPDGFVTIHQLADHIAERDDVDDKAGVYLDLIEATPRLAVERHQPFYEYLAAERGVDTSYYTHGERVRD